MLSVWYNPGRSSLKFAELQDSGESQAKAKLLNTDLTFNHRFISWLCTESPMLRGEVGAHPRDLWAYGIHGPMVLREYH